MLEFKLWLEDHWYTEPEGYDAPPSEYDPPDEKEMQRIRNKPLDCQNPPHLQGDCFVFKMPMGEIHKFVIRWGGIIGLKAAPGSLNHRCFDLKRKGDCEGLYKLMKYLVDNPNKIIRNQLVSYQMT